LVERSKMDFIGIHISNNEYVKPDSKWIYLAVEVAHLLLHKDLLRVPSRERDQNANLIASSEAYLFAQLCMWPIISMFPLDPDKPSSDDQIVDALLKEYEATYKEFDLKIPSDIRSREICWNFLNRLRTLIPEYYNHIANRKL